MKKLLIFLFAVITLYGCQDVYEEDSVENVPTTRTAVDSSDHYYWCDGVKIPLTVNENRLFVLVETAKFKSVSKSAVNTGGKLESSRTIEGHADLGIKTGEQRSLTSFTLDNTDMKSIDTKEVVYVAPYFKTSDSADIGITNIFSVQLKEAQDLDKLKKIAEENNLEMLGENQFDTSIYYLSCTKESKGNALEMANFMYESGAFDYATPEFIIESMPDTDPNDTFFSSQWGLKNNNYPGIDINYVDAMTAFSYPGIGNIIVAVVDNGICNNHTDLPLYNVSYNAHTSTSPSGLYGNHGTAVAGVIGAVTNNNEGIAGVASGVMIMPVSICYTDDAINLGISASTTTHFANAIRWAANNGARVINNSWSFGTSSPISELNSAIAYAYGKGCVVVFSSGNNSGSVSQPAAGVPPALVVGAISYNGMRKSPSTPDGEYWWGSNYGSALDVMAPGVNIPTTDRQSSDGYNKTQGDSGDYVMDFNGTSSAAPHVAGVAALMLSKNPSLTMKQVSDIIESTAQKVGSYSYSPSNHNGTWNEQMGHGLVDAYAAVSTVSQLSTIYINGSSSVFDQTQVTYSIPGTLPSGVTFAGWSVNPGSCTTVGGLNNRNLSITFTAPGQYTLTANFTLQDGTPYSITRTVNVTTLQIHTPVISWELIPYLHPNFMTLVFSVDNPQSGVTYQWEINGVIGSKREPYIAFLSHISTNGTQATSRGLTLRCRAVRNGSTYSTSAWSNVIYHSVQSYTPVNYTPPI